MAAASAQPPAVALTAAQRDLLRRWAGGCLLYRAL